MRWLMLTLLVLLTGCAQTQAPVSEAPLEPIKAPEGQQYTLVHFEADW